MAGDVPGLTGGLGGNRHGVVRLLLRLFGIGVFGYALIQAGAFGGAVWVAAGTALALLLSIGLLVLRSFRPLGLLALVLIVVLMLLGIVLNPAIDFLGSVFYVIGGVLLLGQPEVPLRIGATIAGVLGAILIMSAALAEPQWTVVLSTLFGVAAGLLIGINRRQRVLWLREAARSSELEHRSRIASDLHDVLAHSLGGLVVQLDAASAEVESGQVEAAAARLRTSRQLAVDGLRDARAAVEQLRNGTPPARPAATAVDLVTQLRAVLQGPVGLQLGVELEVIGRERPVPAAVAEPLLVVARESLTNINKHAARDSATAARVSATLAYAADSVRLEVVNALPSAERTAGDLAATGGGLGLAGLRARVETAGGRFQAGPEGRRWVLAVEFPVALTPATRTDKRG